jgi:hypothetical protein
MAQAQLDLENPTRPSTTPCIEVTMPEITAWTVAREVNNSHQSPTTSPLIDAIDCVFETNELLHQLLSDVPVECRHRLRRVSKAWNSVLLSIGCALKPTALYSPSENNSCPVYVTNTTIRLNPTLTDARVPSYLYTRDLPLEPKYITFADNDLTDRAMLFQKRNEFVTAPPITMMGLGADIRDWLGSVAILRVKGGIRVGDLLEFFDKIDTHMPVGVRRVWGADFDEIWKPFACFDICKTWTWVEEFERVRAGRLVGYEAG